MKRYDCCAAAARAGALLLFVTFIATSSPAAWTLVSTPSPSAYGNRLDGLAMISANDVWAVGSATTDSGSNTLIEHWDGGSWSIVASPNATDARCTWSNELHAVAGASANDVWAVGSTRTCDAVRTLVLHWNGASWNIVASPNPPSPANSALFGVYANSDDDVWAVGQTYGDQLPGTAPPLPLIAHWDGRAWSLVPGPSEARDGRLLVITALASNDVWAVGSCPDCRSGTLIEHWDGSQWSIVSGASLPKDATGVLHGIVALSPTEIWAVGQYFDYPEGPQTLIERWDGRRWRVVASPNASTAYGADNVLRSVAAVSPTDIWAVGMFQNESTDVHQHRTLVQHWNGKTWNVVDSPSPGASAELNAIASLRGGTPIAAGLDSDHPINIYDGTYVASRTLIVKP